MSPPAYPSLNQVNTRAWLNGMAGALGRSATLDDVPDAELDRLAAMGFDWVWLLSVWQTGPESRRIARSLPELRRAYEQVLPDLTDDDIGGSGFAVAAYEVHTDLGGDEALARLRERLRRRGLRLMLDFVPNHTGLDHAWAVEHPEYYVTGTEQDVRRSPRDWVRLRRGDRELLLAHGRDPFFPGWTDTLQLDYSSPATLEAMTAELERIAGMCDGVRCDMAMLVLPDVFERTWGRRALSFWPEAIGRVRARAPGFCFLAEVYWDLEWTLQQQGFDYTYDKRLYDRLRGGNPWPVREHLRADIGFQRHLARFLENHDEPRAAAALAPGALEAAAVITYLAPGLRILHQGQLEGRRLRVPPQLVRAPEEPVDEVYRRFYARLLDVLRQPVVRDGRWQMLEPTAAWEDNWTWGCIVVSAWEGQDGERLVVAVNYAANRSQCFVRLPFADLAGRRWVLADVTGGATHERDGHDLDARGLYLDLQPWETNVFALTPA